MAKTKRYLKIHFGDNDFCSYVQEAVEKVSEDIHSSNAHNLSTDPNNEHFSSLTISGIFAKLHKAGALQLLLERAVDAVHHYSEVEFTIRGLYWKKVEWGEKKVSKEFLSITEGPGGILLTLSFHAKRNDKWENGEVVWLDMDTGEVVSK